jgi:catechol 2,3-dioxygenase-like lactoylglutathione lyase family enzyme
MVERGPTGIFHVGFCVRDIERSIRFYRDGLLLVLRHRQIQDNPYTGNLVGYPGAVLHIAQFQLPDQPPPASGHILELIQYLRPIGDPADRQRNRVGAAHLSFIVDDIHASLERAVAHGAEPLSDPVEFTAGINRGGFGVYFYDPDGVNLEFIQPPATYGTPVPLLDEGDANGGHA